MTCGCFYYKKVAIKQPFFVIVKNTYLYIEIKHFLNGTVMRKFIAALVVLTMAFCTSCNSGEETWFEVPLTAGENLGEDEIQIVFAATPDNSTFKFDIVCPPVVKVYVNWGDRKGFMEYAGGTISHTYPAEERDYIVTVRAEGVSSMDVTHLGKGNIKAVYAGDCPALMNFSYTVVNNIFEALDLSRCPQFSDSIFLYVNVPEFDFSGLKNFSSVSLTVTENSDISIKGMSASSIRIFMKKPPRIFEIYDCENLYVLELSGYNSPMKSKVNLWDPRIEAPSLKYFYTVNVRFGKTLDMSGFHNLTHCELHSFDAPAVVFNDELEYVRVNNYDPVKFGGSYIEELDFRNAKGLREIDILRMENLKKVYLEGLENLELVLIQKCCMDDYFYYEPGKASLSAGSGEYSGGFESDYSAGGVVVLKAI